MAGSTPLARDDAIITATLNRMLASQDPGEIAEARRLMRAAGATLSPPRSRERVYGPAQERPEVVPYVRKLWGWRRFITQLSRSELRAENYDTFFGQVWNVLNPLLMATVYLLLLTVVRRGDSAPSPDHTAKLLLGIFVYTFVRTGLTKGTQSIVSGGRLLLNAVFPKAVMPVSAVWMALIQLVPTMLVYAVLHVLLGRPITWALLALPVLLALLYVMVTGGALFLGALTVSFRDMTSLIGHSLRYLLYMTPILYSASDVPDVLRPVIIANPLYPVFVGLQSIVDGRFPDAAYMLGAMAWAAASLAIGGWFFLVKERRLALAI